MNSGNELQRFLKVLLTRTLTGEEKERRLVDDFRIEMNNHTKQEVNKMTNLSEGIWEEGLAQGKEEERKNNISCFANYIMANEGLNREEAEAKARDIFSNTNKDNSLVM